jgi:hypothetical protein
MTAEESPPGGARGPGGVHEGAFQQPLHFGPREAGHGHPARETQNEDHQQEARFPQRHQSQQEDETWDRQSRVGDGHEQPPPPKSTEIATDRMPTLKEMRVP